VDLATTEVRIESEQPVKRAPLRQSRVDVSSESGVDEEAVFIETPKPVLAAPPTTAESTPSLVGTGQQFSFEPADVEAKADSVKSDTTSIAVEQNEAVEDNINDEERLNEIIASENEQKSDSQSAEEIVAFPDTLVTDNTTTSENSSEEPAPKETETFEPVVASLDETETIVNDNVPLAEENDKAESEESVEVAEIVVEKQETDNAADLAKEPEESSDKIMDENQQVIDAPEQQSSSSESADTTIAATTAEEVSNEVEVEETPQVAQLSEASADSPPREVSSTDAFHHNATLPIEHVDESEVSIEEKATSLPTPTTCIASEKSSAAAVADPCDDDEPVTVEEMPEQDTKASDSLVESEVETAAKQPAPTEEAANEPALVNQVESSLQAAPEPEPVVLQENEVETEQASKKERRLSVPGGKPRVTRIASSDFSSESEDEDQAAGVDVEIDQSEARTDTEEKINRTIEQMKRELDSDTDIFESLASDNTMTDVSSMDQYASCETLDSIATMTEEQVSRPVSGVFKETDVMMAETENLIKSSYDAVYKALGATDDEDNGEYEDIPSDLKALKLTTPRKEAQHNMHVEKELGKIASDIDRVADNVADNVQKSNSSSSENILTL